MKKKKKTQKAQDSAPLYEATSLRSESMARAPADLPKEYTPSESISPKALEGLRSLFSAGVIRGNSGIAAKQLFLFVAQASDPTLTVRDAYAYRSRESVAVAVQLHHPPGATKWTASQAVLRLVGTSLELPRPLVWQAEALGTNKNVWVMVEIAATQEQARGTYTLVLWEAGGTRPVTLEGITFP